MARAQYIYTFGYRTMVLYTARAPDAILLLLVGAASETRTNEETKRKGFTNSAPYAKIYKWWAGVREGHPKRKEKQKTWEKALQTIRRMLYFLSGENEMKYEIPSEVLDRVYEVIQELEDVALRHNSTEEETFIHCTLCDTWESHKAECPIAMLYNFTLSVAP
jgi:hypothetical protein